jgi:hypothetical protein
MDGTEDFMRFAKIRENPGRGNLVFGVVAEQHH